MALGRCQLFELFFGHACAANQLQQADRRAVCGRCALAVGRNLVPHHVVVIGRAGQVAITDVGDVVVLLFVARVTGGDIAADRPGQLFGRQTQLVRQAHGVVTHGIGGVYPLLRHCVGQEQRRHGHYQTHSEPYVAGERRPFLKHQRSRSKSVWGGSALHSTHTPALTGPPVRAQ